MTERRLLSYPKWFWALAALVLALSSLPYAFAYFTKPPGSVYLGVHSNIDDHAVYAAWMKQAQEGRFFFENRFTSDAQPRLTVHLYFFVLGLLSKATGIPVAMHVGRLIASLLFLVTLYGLVRRVTATEFQTRMAMIISVFGAGVGWLMWRRYGHEGPIDVWQPEAFTFSSLMTNGLFAISLWLILVVWTRILDSRNSWKPVLPGFLAALILANIHTYDVLLIALVGVAFLLSRLIARDFEWIWLARTCIIALGALISILWFVYVRANDPVFAARADTPTFSPFIVQVLMGLAPMFPFAVGLAMFMGGDTNAAGWRRLAFFPAGLLVILAVLAFASAIAPPQSFVFGTGAFLGVFAIAAMLCGLLRIPDSTKGFLVCWAIIGIVALYYPGLFQRKLAMGLSLPFGILTGIGIAMLIEKLRNHELRVLTSAIAAVLLSLSSLRYLQREMLMARDDISNTALHRVYLSQDASAILRYLARHKTSDDLLVAIPGIMKKTGDDTFEVVVTDLNPIMTGWAGIKTYAGHWSETPKYTERRQQASKLFAPTIAHFERQSLLIDISPTYVIVPSQFLQEPWFSLPNAKPTYTGKEFTLLSLRR